MNRLTLGIVLVLLTPSLALAADHDVRTVTRAIENQYGIKHKGLPWIARLAMKPAMWGSGTKLDLAMFENVPVLAGRDMELDSLMKNTLGPEWTRFIRAESRRTGERSIIYVHTTGDKLEMMIVSIEPDEAVVLKLRTKPEEMQKWIADPDEMAFHDNRENDGNQQACAGQRRKTKDGFVRTGTE